MSAASAAAQDGGQLGVGARRRAGGRWAARRSAETSVRRVAGADRPDERERPVGARGAPAPRGASRSSFVADDRAGEDDPRARQRGDRRVAPGRARAPRRTARCRPRWAPRARGPRACACGRRARARRRATRSARAAKRASAARNAAPGDALLRGDVVDAVVDDRRSGRGTSTQRLGLRDVAPQQRARAARGGVPRGATWRAQQPRVERRSPRAVVQRARRAARARAARRRAAARAARAAGGGRSGAGRARRAAGGAARATRRTARGCARPGATSGAAGSSTARRPSRRSRRTRCRGLPGAPVQPYCADAPGPRSGCAPPRSAAPGALAVYFGFNSGGYFPGAARGRRRRAGRRARAAARHRAPPAGGDVAAAARRPSGRIARPSPCWTLDLGGMVGRAGPGAARVRPRAALPARALIASARSAYTPGAPGGDAALAGRGLLRDLRGGR